MTADDSDGGFDIWPIPKKRRRIVLDDEDDDSAVSTSNCNPVAAKRTKSRPRHRQREPPPEQSPKSNAIKGPKPKHRVCTLEDSLGARGNSSITINRAASMAEAVPASQPWSLRGAIWAPASPGKPIAVSSRLQSGNHRQSERPHVSLVQDCLQASHDDVPFENSTAKESSTQDAPSPRRMTAEYSMACLAPHMSAQRSPKTVALSKGLLNDHHENPFDVGRSIGNPIREMPSAELNVKPTLDDNLQFHSNTKFAENDMDTDYGSDDFDFDTIAVHNPKAIVAARIVRRESVDSSHDISAKSCPTSTLAVEIPSNSRDRITDSDHLRSVLVDLPSDAFSDPEMSSPGLRRISQLQFVDNAITVEGQSHRTMGNGLRQMTLFGDRADTGSDADGMQPTRLPSLLDETPTHHRLNAEGMKRWVYPMNLGTVRDYQYNIVARGLFNNLLVALPTGLGKTFIAATIMLNWYKWTRDAQIVFVAPTRPLVSQQVDACFNVAGISRSDTAMLTGGVPPGLRAEEWSNKRVFFMTPQTLVNDLKSGICDPKRLVLLVVDEAHRATGSYAYVVAVEILRRFNQSFRILALTATPGNSISAVQNVIDGLGISRVEIRTEFSLDIRQYIHSKNIDRKIFDNTDEMVMIMDLWSKAVQPLVNKLCQFNAFWSRDPLSMTAYGLTQARQKWMVSEGGRNASASVKGMVTRIFQVLASLAHGLDLLKYHGIGPFYHNLSRFRDAQAVAKSGKFEREVLESEHLQRMMARVQFWISNDDFIGHPKLEFLQSSILEHFTNSGPSASAPSTRVMIFAHFRDSAEEIVRVLKRNSPIIRPHVFVGQATSKDSEGMDQKRQLETINEFKTGKYNTLVATSIGEEGLDIGEIDLIICYDSSASPIRMLQRMGRTGRKRAGRILLLLMRGKEENSFVQAKDNYEKMQHIIAEGTQFDFHEDLSPRIVPSGIHPELDKCVVDIPVENKQPGLPEPSRKGRRAPKRPPKKFNMPDGVATGFVQASRMRELSGKGETKSAHNNQMDLVVPPRVDDVLLTVQEERDFERQYLNVAAGSTELVEFPDVTNQPGSQRQVGGTCLVPHGDATSRITATLRVLHDFSISIIERWDSCHVPLDITRLCGPDQSVERPPQSAYERTPRNIPDELPVAKFACSEAAQASLPKKRIIQKKQNLRGTTEAMVPKASSRKKSGKSFRGKRRDEAQSASANHFEAVEGCPSSLPATDPRMRIASQAIDLGSSDTISGYEDDYGEIGSLDEFLANSSDLDTHEGHVTQSLTSELGRDVDSHHNASMAHGLSDIGGSPDGSLPDLDDLRKRVPQRKPAESRGQNKRKRKIVDDSD